MDWKEYLFGVIALSVGHFLFLVLLLRCQHWLPWNPQQLPAVPWGLAVNTAVSFVTNTNWQAYSGENCLSYFVQTVGLTVHNFLSAATGMAVMMALIRGIVRRKTHHLGNFWVDLTRVAIRVLLPWSLVGALFLASQGVVQTFSPYIEAMTIEGARQMIPLGPAASQIAIKQLGTNGGGFFGMNSAHPFENPTALANFVEMLFLLLIPAASVWAYGKLVGSRRHGIALLAAMTVFFVLVLSAALWSEYQPNPALGGLPFLEGKETRLGIMNSVLWSQATTLASNGSVNAMHSSMSPLTATLAMFNMAVGEVIFGGVGSGVYGMAMFVIFTVFIAGLMVGRTPEYLGKKIEASEVRSAAIAILVPNASVLFFSALACLLPSGLAGLSHGGPHGLSEILYTFISTSNNNGSAFGGLDATTAFYCTTTSIAMLLGRYAVIGAVLAIAGSLSRKDYTPPSAGTFPTDGVIFAILLLAVVVIIGGLTFFPALALGPVMEHLAMLQGRVF